MKSENDLKELIRQWEADPCWDIEETEGFEEYKESLKSYRLEKEGVWNKQRSESILRECNELGVSPAMLSYIKKLELYCDSLNNRLDALENDIGGIHKQPNKRGYNMVNEELEGKRGRFYGFPIGEFHFEDINETAARMLANRYPVWRKTL